MSLGAVSANGFASLKKGHDNSRDIPEFISFVERTKSVRNAPLFSKTTREKFGAFQKASMEKYEEER